MDPELLRTSLEAQQAWLTARADELQSGALKAILPRDGGDVDVSAAMAEDYRHRANNLQTVIQCYERMRAREAMAPGPFVR